MVTEASMPSSLFLLGTTIVVTLIFLFLLVRARSHNNEASHLLLGPPALIFITKFLVRRRSIFYQAPLLHDLHERYGPVISLDLTCTLLIFVADRRLAHQIFVQDDATFADRTPPVDPVTSLLTAGGQSVGTTPYGASCTRCAWYSGRYRQGAWPAMNGGVLHDRIEYTCFVLIDRNVFLNFFQIIIWVDLLH
jgi:hypothetical protein